MTAVLSSLGPLTIGSTTIATLSLTPTMGLLKLLAEHSGLPYPGHEVIPGAEPRLRFRCFFQDIWALAGATVLQATTFTAYLAKYDSLVRSSSSDHGAFALASSAKAAVLINNVSVEQGGLLIADSEAVFLAADSDTNPMAPLATNVALPSLTAAPIIHTLGPTVIDGTGRAGVSGYSYDFGHRLEVAAFDGDRYPKIAALVGGVPVQTWDHADPRAILGDLAANDGRRLSSGIVQYFRRFNATTGLVGAANGVSFTTASGFLAPTEQSNEHGRVSRIGFECTGLSSSTTHPTAVSTSATVPAAA